MDPLVVIASVGLAAAAALYVAAPLFPSARQEEQSEAGRHLRQLRERKEDLLASIRELEMDNEVGKLTPEDYARLRGELDAEAIAVLDELDGLAPGADDQAAADWVEAAVAERRQQTRNSQAAAATACPACGAARRPGDVFCSHCGARYPEAGDPA